MSYEAMFGLSVALGFVAWGIVTRQYIWPALRSRPRADALRPILTLHGFRFIGLSFLVPGVVSPDLPIGFARPAGYGDLTTAILALAALRSQLGIVLAWVFSVVGTADLLNGFYQGNRVAIARAPGQLGATYFMLTVLVPLLLITHGLAFWLLLRRSSVAAR